MTSAGPWRTGICDDCCRTPTCCLACIVPCAVFGYNVHLMQLTIKSERIPQCPQYPLVIPVCAGSLYLAGLSAAGVIGNTTGPWANALGCLSIAMHSAVRHEIRTHVKIQQRMKDDCCDSPWGDCCCAIWCYSCAMAQENRLLNRLYDEEHLVTPTHNSMMENVPLIHPTAPSLNKLNKL